MPESDLIQSLLDEAEKNNPSAIAELLALHRSKVRRLIEIHMDRRLSSRIDPSDVVQETLVTAIREFPKYLHQRPVRFYPWLRSIAMNRLVDVHRRHLLTKRRSVKREEPTFELQLPDESRRELANRLIHPGSSPSRHLERAEVTERTNAALAALPPGDREILVLKYLEELSAPEIAVVMNITERTVWRRHARAIEKISRALDVV